MTRDEYNAEIRIRPMDERYLMGDANCDGVINLTDALAVGRYLAGEGTLPLGGIVNADINESGEPDVKDAMNLLHYACGEMTYTELCHTAPIYQRVDFC